MYWFVQFVTDEGIVVKASHYQPLLQVGSCSTSQLRSKGGKHTHVGAVTKLELAQTLSFSHLSRVDHNHNPLSPIALCTVRNVHTHIPSNHRCPRTELLFFLHPLQQRDVTRSLAEKKTSLSASVSSLKQQIHIYQTQLKDKEKLIK